MYDWNYYPLGLKYPRLTSENHYLSGDFVIDEDDCIIDIEWDDNYNIKVGFLLGNNCLFNWNPVFEWDYEKEMYKVCTKN